MDYNLQLMVSNLIGTWLTPKIDKILDSNLAIINSKSKLVWHDLMGSKFKDYFERRLAKFAYIETLVFPNQQVKIDDVYIPLSIELKGVGSQYKSIIKIDEYPDSALKKFKRVMIVDGAGMGKSTIAKKIFIEAIKSNSSLPVLIELRRINNENTLLNEIFNQFSSIDDEGNDEILIKELMLRGDFLFILDGLDEVDSSIRDVVLNDIDIFIEKRVSNNFIITSRPDENLVSFGDFLRANIVPLDINESFLLFEKYDQFSINKIANNLKSILEDEVDLEIRKFLKTPLLASLIYKSFEVNKDIPLQLERFYREVYDAMYKNHDLSKEGYFKRKKKSGLDIDSFERVMRVIGILTTNSGKSEFGKNELLDIIEDAKRFCSGLTFKASELLDDLLSQVPLLKKDGSVYYWVHKSLQDYFAARFIHLDSDSNKNKILEAFSRKSGYGFVLELYSYMDPKVFRNVILKPYLESYFSQYNEIKKVFKNRLNHQDQITIAKLTFQRRMYVLSTKVENLPNEKYDEINSRGLVASEQEGIDLEYDTVVKDEGNKIKELLKSKSNLDGLSKPYYLIYRFNKSGDFLSHAFSRTVSYNIWYPYYFIILYPDLFNISGGYAEQMWDEENISYLHSLALKFDASIDAVDLIGNDQDSNSKIVDALFDLFYYSNDEYIINHQHAIDIYQQIENEQANNSIIDEILNV